MSNRTALFKLYTFLFLVISLLFWATPPAHAATPSFTFSQTNYDLNNACIGTVQIMIDPGGYASNAAEIFLNYDSSKIEILDSISTQPGTQIAHGQAFPVYAGNVVNPSTGTIRLTGFGSTLGQKAVFAEISVKAKTGTGNTPLNFVFFGASPMNTTDSNIADAATSNDVLSAVQNTTITFGSGACAQDTTPPTVNFQTPQHMAQNVPSNSAVTFTITDPGSGVDIDSLVITINGVQYTETHPAVSIVGDSGSYIVTVMPTTPFPEDEPSSISVQISDFAGNTRTHTISFNLGQTITPTCPAENTQDTNGIWTPCTQAIVKNLSERKDSALFSILYNGAAVSLVDTLSMAILGILAALMAILGLASLRTLLRYLWAQLTKGSSDVILTVTTGNEGVDGVEMALFTAQGEKVLQSFTLNKGELKGKLRKGTYLAKVVQANYVISGSSSHITSYDGSPANLSIIRTATKLWFFVALTLAAIAGILVLGNIYTYAATGREISLILLAVWSLITLLSLSVAVKQR